MKNSITRCALIAMLLAIPFVAGCGKDTEGTIVGGPTDEVMAQYDKAKQGYGDAMKEAQANDPAN